MWCLRASSALIILLPMHHLCLLFPPRDSTSCHRLCWVLLRGQRIRSVHSCITPPHDDFPLSLLWLWPDLLVIRFTVETTVCCAMQLIIEVPGSCISCRAWQPAWSVFAASQLCLLSRKRWLGFLLKVAHTTDVKSAFDQSECILCYSGRKCNKRRKVFFFQ